MANTRSVVAALLISEFIEEDDQKTRGKTRGWIRKREEKGAFANIVQELMLGDTTTYREMMRMSHSSFKVLLNFIEPYISPVESFCGNKVIKSPERLALTIRFLATGESFHS